MMRVLLALVLSFIAVSAEAYECPKQISYDFQKESFGHGYPEEKQGRQLLKAGQNVILSQVGNCTYLDAAGKYQAVISEGSFLPEFDEPTAPVNDANFVYIWPVNNQLTEGTSLFGIVLDLKYLSEDNLNMTRIFQIEFAESCGHGGCHEALIFGAPAQNVQGKVSISFADSAKKDFPFKSVCKVGGRAACPW